MKRFFSNIESLYRDRLKFTNRTSNHSRSLGQIEKNHFPFSQSLSLDRIKRTEKVVGRKSSSGCWTRPIKQKLNSSKFVIRWLLMRAINFQRPLGVRADVELENLYSTHRSRFRRKCLHFEMRTQSWSSAEDTREKNFLLPYLQSKIYPKYLISIFISKHRWSVHNIICINIDII